MNHQRAYHPFLWQSSFQNGWGNLALQTPPKSPCNGITSSHTMAYPPFSLWTKQCLNLLFRHLETVKFKLKNLQNLNRNKIHLRKNKKIIFQTSFSVDSKNLHFQRNILKLPYLHWAMKAQFLPVNLSSCKELWFGSPRHPTKDGHGTATWKKGFQHGKKEMNHILWDSFWGFSHVLIFFIWFWCFPMFLGQHAPTWSFPSFWFILGVGFYVSFFGCICDGGQFSRFHETKKQHVWEMNACV